MMEYREFVEVLMAEIKDETGLKTEFHESDEKMPQDSIWVYMSEDNGSSNIVRLFTAESYNQWTQRKTTFPALVRDIKKSVEIINILETCFPMLKKSIGFLRLTQSDNCAKLESCLSTLFVM